MHSLTSSPIHSQSSQLQHYIQRLLHPPIRNITNRMNYIFNDTIVLRQYSMIQLYWAKPKAKAKAKPKAKPRAKAKPKAKPKAKAKAKGKAKGKGQNQRQGQRQRRSHGQRQRQRQRCLIGELLFSNSLFLRSTPLAPRQGLFDMSQNVTNRINLHGRGPGKRESAEKGGPQPGPARGPVVLVNRRIPACILLK